MARTVDLNSARWTVRAVGDLGAVPAAIRGIDIPARVPGCVHTDLMRAGLIGDPVVGFNELEVQWIGMTDWEYGLCFDAEGAVFEHERIDLVCEGLDTIAELRLNGAAIGSAANMFHPHRFDVRGALRAGANELSIVFRSPLRHIRAEEARVGARPVNGDWDPYVFIRKAACRFGWDWAPKLATSGIWRPIRIEAWDRVRIEQVRPLVSRGEGDRWLVDVHVDAEAAGPGMRVEDLEVVVELGPTHTRGVRSDWRAAPTRARAAKPLGYVLAGSRGTVRVPVEVEGPEMWWPHRHGYPTLYGLAVSIRSAGAAETSEEVARAEMDIGFRTVRLVTEPDRDGGGGAPFTLEVNGKPVFCLGANWIPEGPYPPTELVQLAGPSEGLDRLDQFDFDPKGIDSRVRDAAGAGMNMLRVWGGGFYEHDAFYRACDRHGVLVWQDFMFACAMYPEEAPYPALVEAEARHQVARLSSHPSVALWCGGNECVWAHESWGAAEGKAWKERLDGRTWGSGYYFEMLPRLVAELDPTRPYWANSPWSGDGEIHHRCTEGTEKKRDGTGAVPTNDAHHGDRHTWDVRGDGYRKLVPRFCSEFGHQGPANYATLARVIAPEGLRIGSAELEHRQRGTGGMARHIDEAITEAFRSPRGFDEWHYLAQLVQARSLVTGVEWMRANRGRCMGALVWQLNDCWPGMSWSLIDADGKRKPAYWAVRRAMERRHLTVQPVDGRLVVMGINDSDEPWKGKVFVRRVAMDGTVLAKGEATVNVEARGVGRVAEVERLVGGPVDPARELVVVDAGVKRAWWFHRPDKALVYPAARFETAVDRNASFCTVRLRALSLLRDVVFCADRLAPAWDTHAEQPVSLLPGESVEFHWEGQGTGGRGEPAGWEERLRGPPVMWCANYFGVGT